MLIACEQTGAYSATHAAFNGAIWILRRPEEEPHGVQLLGTSSLRLLNWARRSHEPWRTPHLEAFLYRYFQAVWPVFKFPFVIIFFNTWLASLPQTDQIEASCPSRQLPPSLT